MHFMTRKSLAAEAADGWERQYCRNGEWSSEPFREIGRRLRALGESPDPDDVDRIIGNQGWTWLRCDECGRTTPEIVATVRLGEPPDYESSTADVCSGCIAAAHHTMSRQDPS